MYSSIIRATLRVLQHLPTPLPQKGTLAGIVGQPGPQEQEMFAGDNFHYPMGTAYLELGLLGVAQRAEASAMQVGLPKNKSLLQGIGQVYRGIAAWVGRYADAVLAAAEGDPRLLRIGENLQALAWRAPKHFDEALQLTGLMWMLRCLGRSGSDIGRLDVHLRPWFEADIASGYATEASVLEGLCDFWTLLNENRTGDTLNNIMLGGRNPDGSDAGSRLSVLMLKATQRCGLPEPHINVRVHPNLHQDIYQAMLEVQLMGQGQATVYNDKVVIPSLVRYGVPEALACCYTNDGCTEIVLDGYSGIDFVHIDAVAAFELAFNNGSWAERIYRKPVSYYHRDGAVNYYTPDCVAGFESGRPEDCADFESFYQQFLSQYRFQVRHKFMLLQRCDADRRSGAASSVLLNGTYAYVLESGTDILQGGFPFAAYMLFSGSIPTVADCLIAVKELVFEKKRYTLAQIKEAIRVDFAGCEPMRRQMLSCPKFGNDEDSVDFLAADIAMHFVTWLEELREQTGFAVMPAMIGWQFMNEAYGVAATPDGRHYGDPIAEHYCATPGRAVQGPTALIRSVGKARAAIERAAGVCAVHVTLPRNLGNNHAQSLEILNSLVKAAISGGLSFLNISIYDAELLLRVQEDPENHRDVVVRVWGYSARFVDLCKEMQDHIISRISDSR